MKSKQETKLLNKGYYYVNCTDSNDQKNKAVEYTACGYYVRKITLTTRVKGFYELALMVKPGKVQMATYGLFGDNEVFLGYAYGNPITLKEDSKLKLMPIKNYKLYTVNGFEGELLNW